MMQKNFRTLFNKRERIGFFERLITLNDRIDPLMERGVTIISPEFVSWHVNADLTLRTIFGKDSAEYNGVVKVSYKPKGKRYPRLSDYVDACHAGLTTARRNLKKATAEFAEAEFGGYADYYYPKNEYKNVFVIGDECELKNDIIRFAKENGLNPVSPEKDAVSGKTTEEKIDSMKRVEGAIFVFPAETNGKRTSISVNTLLETRYLTEKLGQDKIVGIVASGAITPPGKYDIIMENDIRRDKLLKIKLRLMSYKIEGVPLYIDEMFGSEKPESRDV